MHYITLKSAKTDKLTFNPSSTIKFEITLSISLPEDSDLNFSILYIGNPNNDDHDQKLSEDIVGPIQNGTFKFDLETNQIDINKIPKESLFGVTSILIKGTYKECEFLRVGFFVNVTYPELPTSLIEINENDSLEEENSYEIEYDEAQEDESLVYESSSENEGVEEENGEEEGVESGEKENEEVEKDGEEEEGVEEDGEGKSEENEGVEKENEEEGVENESENEKEEEKDEEEEIIENDDKSEENEKSEDSQEIVHNKSEYLENPLFQCKNIEKDQQLEINGFILDKSKILFTICEPPLITEFDCFNQEEEIEEEEIDEVE